MQEPFEGKNVFGVRLCLIFIHHFVFKFDRFRTYYMFVCVCVCLCVCVRLCMCVITSET